MPDRFSGEKFMPFARRINIPVESEASRWAQLSGLGNLRATEAKESCETSFS